MNRREWLQSLVIGGTAVAAPARVYSFLWSNPVSLAWLPPGFASEAELEAELRWRIAAYWDALSAAIQKSRDSHAPWDHLLAKDVQEVCL